MNWKLLLMTVLLIIEVSARPAEDSTINATPEASTLVTEKTATTSTERTTTKRQAKLPDVVATTTSSPLPLPTKATMSDDVSTLRPKKENEKSEEKRDAKAPQANENRELKATSKVQMTSGNVKSEMTVKEPSFHHGIAVPMSLEDYEKEIAREKELLNKAKKKLSMETSTQKEGISTWILLSGSHPTARPEMKPAFRIDNAEKKPAKNMTMTTKKRNPTTPTTKLPKTTPKYNKPITRVKVTTNGSMNETEIEVTTKTVPTTKKVQLTTKAKKYTTLRPKTPTKTTTTTVATTKAPKTTTTTTTTEAVEIIDDDTDIISSAPAVENPTFLIMEPKDADFNLPDDRSPAKTASPKKPSKDAGAKNKKKKKIAPVTTNNTRIKKKSDKKNTKLVPQKPITTQLYNYLAREVMPTVGVGLVGLVVTAGLATYFLGGPLTALRRSYDISNRRDDIAFDRSDDFGNSQAEEEMFGKVIAGMPENSPYRSNIRVSPYRPKVQQYSGYSQYMQQSPKYGTQQQHLRYRTIDPYQNSYQNQAAQYQQYYQQQIQAQAQAKSAVVDYGAQQQQQQQPVEIQPSAQPSLTQSKFNIDAVDMTTREPEHEASYGMTYDEIAQSYYPQQDPTQMIIDQQQQQQKELEQQQQQIIQESEPQAESQRSEKITIVQAQSVPSNHRNEDEEQELPKPEALTMSHSEEEYQSSIANAIMNQQKQFVVGSVIADHYEENPSGAVPEHGPRRRRRREALRKVAKSLENNEIDGEEENKLKRESDSTTAKAEEEATTPHSDHSTSQTVEESTTQYPNYTFNIDNGHNNIFDLFRRLIDLKLRMGLNFLQNATVAFQRYLQGVEQRVNSSPLFNPYNKTSSQTSNAKNNQHHKYEGVKSL